MAEKSNENKNNKVKSSFFKDVKAELKKVTWPTPKQVLNNTTGVIIIVIITAIIVFALDFTFKNFNEYGVNALKEKINAQSSENIVSENVVESEDTDNTVTNNTITENTVNEISNQVEN